MTFYAKINIIIHGEMLKKLIFSVFVLYSLHTSTLYR